MDRPGFLNELKQNTLLSQILRPTSHTTGAPEPHLASGYQIAGNRWTAFPCLRKFFWTARLQTFFCSGVGSHRGNEKSYLRNVKRKNHLIVSPGLWRIRSFNNNRAVQIRLLSWKTNVHVSLPPPLTFQPRSQDIWGQRAPHRTEDSLT